MAVYRVNAVSSGRGSQAIARKIREWHDLRVQPIPILTRKIEKKIINGVYVAASRVRRGEFESEFTTIWAAAETHPIGYAPCPKFDHVERMTIVLATFVQSLGYSAEMVRDDASYVCYTGTKSTKPQSFTIIGLRVADLSKGELGAIQRLNFSTRSSVFMSLTATITCAPRLVKKSE